MGDDIMSEPVPRILGVGYAVPPDIRTNDDPIFDWIKQHQPPGTNLFQGYLQRRVLTGNLLSIMVPAALGAIADAGIRPADVDMLLGDASVSQYATPNDLCLLHRELLLPERAWTIPLNNEFSNFNAGLVLADALIRAGRAQTILVAVGGNWTKHVDYHTPQSVSASDGAGAAVVGLSDDPNNWQVIDQNTITESQYFGTMIMRGERIAVSPPQQGHDHLWTRPDFQINQAGIEGFQTFGGGVAPTAATALLQRHGLAGSDISLITHQASTVLSDAWAKVIHPAQYILTIAQFANMTVANIPVNLAWAEENQPIVKDNLVLLGVGPDMHANAVLLRRGGP